MIEKLRIINKLYSTNDTLNEVVELLENQNQNGNQFDCENSPRLVDSLEAVEKNVEKIKKIVYKK